MLAKTDIEISQIIIPDYINEKIFKNSHPIINEVSINGTMYHKIGNL